MNLRLTSSSLALVLSTKSVVGDENDVANHVAALTKSVNASYQKNAAASNQHRAVQSSQSSSNPDGTANKLDAADVGVLGGSGTGRRRRRGNDLFGKNRRRRAAAPSNDQLRFLQDEDDEDEDTCEKPDTCEPNLCACVAAGGKAMECTTELNNVCNGVTVADKVFTIEGCVNWPDYYNNLYCPFAKCLVENGGTPGTCSCNFYATSYEMYKDDPRYTNDEDTLQHFAAHACCQTKDDDDEDGKLSCIEDAPTSMPSVAPSAPTTSPTNDPTGSPSFTASPTISPKPTSSPTTASPTKKAVATVAWDGTSATRPTPPDKPITDGSPAGAPPTLDSAPSSGATATDSPPAEGATPPTPGAPAAPINSAQNTMSWGVAGSAMQFLVAAIVWSLLA